MRVGVIAERVVFATLIALVIYAGKGKVANARHAIGNDEGGCRYHARVLVLAVLLARVRGKGASPDGLEAIRQADGREMGFGEGAVVDGLEVPGHVHAGKVEIPGKGALADALDAIGKHHALQIAVATGAVTEEEAVGNLGDRRVGIKDDRPKRSREVIDAIDGGNRRRQPLSWSHSRSTRSGRLDRPTRTSCRGCHIFCP
jgi:hypothetical protein